MSDQEFLNDPYNPQVPPADSDTHPLPVIINEAISAALYDTHTWLPCTIHAVRDNGFVDLQPTLKRVYANGKTVTLPIIQHCMVCQPRGANYYMNLPISEGDSGVALFCERSLDIWSVSGGIVDPEDPRKHDLTDAIFIPGIFPASNPIPGGVTTDLVINNGQATITLDAAGKFKVKGVVDELLELISELMDQCSLIQNIGGPTFNAAAFTALKVRLDLMKG